MKKLLFKFARPWYAVYEGDGDGDGAGDGGAGTGTGTGADSSGSGTGSGTSDDDKPTISQKKLNSLLAEEKRKYKAQIDTQVKQLEQFQKAKGLTEKEKGDLQARIEELNNSLLTKEQLAQKESEKLRNEHKTVVTEIANDRDNWKKLFQGSTITRTIQDEAIKAEAFNPTQIVNLLQANTRLTEATDGEGNPIPSTFIPKVTLQDTDKDGKPITLDLTVAEALKRMKDRPEEFGNLFKSGVQGGLGGNSGRSANQKDVAKMTPDEYRSWRNHRLGRKK